MALKNPDENKGFQAFIVQNVLFVVLLFIE